MTSYIYQPYLPTTEALAKPKAALRSAPVTELPHIAAWRDSYRSFGARSTKTRNSLEVLTRDVEAGLHRVNCLTDIYNAISVKHESPFGGEDLDEYTGIPFLICADGSEKFVAAAAREPPDKGGPVWCDDAGMTCRRWTWCQGPGIALSEQSTNVLFHP